ncbi:hypothetical protein HZH68_013387 [Vespula germanica]|uniref:Uncharacterized protein n=1 Tax=Vespula germanica TaxID=30212 RepID=A0A834MVQ4_VESGE|nr:hypothetical protein HZH68_013387 [Vespula germanica]
MEEKKRASLRSADSNSTVCSPRSLLAPSLVPRGNERKNSSLLATVANNNDNDNNNNINNNNNNNNNSIDDDDSGVDTIDESLRKGGIESTVHSNVITSGISITRSVPSTTTSTLA